MEKLYLNDGDYWRRFGHVGWWRLLLLLWRATTPVSGTSSILLCAVLSSTDKDLPRNHQPMLHFETRFMSSRNVVNNQLLFGIYGQCLSNSHTISFISSRIKVYSGALSRCAVAITKTCTPCCYEHTILHLQAVTRRSTTCKSRMAYLHPKCN